MIGQKRRNEIINILATSHKAISASALALRFDVSRQIIVGDIALIRAEGTSVKATSKGYILDHHTGDGLCKIVAVSHSSEHTERELRLLVELGVAIIDVTVEHEVYGQLVGQLNIKTQDDVTDFINHDGELLSSLTGGIHLHTIVVDSEAHYNEVLKALADANLLYSN